VRTCERFLTMPLRWQSPVGAFVAIFLLLDHQFRFAAAEQIFDMG
jgi:hypothetical protein